MPKFTFNHISLCLLVFFLVFSSSVNSQDDACIEEKPCLCELSDNRYITLSDVASGQYIKTILGNITFYFSPCDNVIFNPPTKVNTIITNNCKEPTSLCIYDATDHTMNDFGKIQDSTFTTGLPKKIVYTTETHTVTILLVCTLEDITALAPLTTAANNYILALVSPDVCVKHSHGGMSIGSKLLIMFAVVAGITVV